MSEWNRDAKRLLSKYTLEFRQRAKKAGFDANDLAGELEAHLQRDAEECAGDGPVTIAILKAVIETVGSPKDVLLGADLDIAGDDDEVGALLRRANAGYNDAHARHWRRQRIFWGIVFPLAAILFEVFLAPMANFYLDPMPTLAHLALLLLAPGGIGYLTVRLYPGTALPSAGSKRMVCIVLGMVLTQSLLYSIAYLPSIFISAFFIIALGTGAFGFAPYACLAVSVYYLFRLFRTRKTLAVSKVTLVSGILCGALAVALFHTVYVGMQYRNASLLANAVSMEPAVSDKAISLLRAKHLEQYAMNRSRSSNDLLNSPLLSLFPFTSKWLFFPKAPNPATAQRLYYRLTGCQYDTALPSPPLFFRERPALFNEVSNNENAGVSALPSSDISLKTSAMEGNLSSFDGGSGTAYLEWTLTFQNSAPFDQEARTRILLPGGGVVSRLTLWVNGEEQEAAFGGRNQTMQAYREVAVVQRRDPALVTTDGPDVVHLQCFPVPAGDSLKVKLGITAPLMVRGGSSCLRLPRLADSEFRIPSDTVHAVWLECNSAMECHTSTLESGRTPENTFTLHGKLSNPALDAPETGTLHTPFSAAVLPFTASGRLGGYEGSMRLSDADGTAGPPKTIWLAVDGSACMSSVGMDWAAALRAFPEGCAVNAAIYGDTVTLIENRGRDELAAALTAYAYAGGQDAVPALETVLNRIEGEPDTILLWVHGPQPFEFASPAPLVQQFKRSKTCRSNGAPCLLSIAAAPGKHTLSLALDGLPGFAECPLLDSLQGTLEAVARTGLPEDVIPEFSVRPAATPDAPNEGSGHVVRLAAAAEVARILLGNAPGNVETAQTIATRLRLVTPVTGAVVLERKEQYDAHQLDPGKNKDTIPGVPEPEEWALIATAALVAVTLFLRNRAKNAGRKQAASDLR